MLSSLGVACVAAAIIGANIGMRSGGTWLGPAMRQVGLVALAAGVTYEIGRLFQGLGTAISP